MARAPRLALALSVVSALLFGAPERVEAQTIDVGATAGELGVSETGAASYSIPITVPPGTAGVQPKMTLQWNSNTGNSIAGVGWSIGGLSAIARCPKDLFHDGEITAVTNTPDDRLCLNGQRLVGVEGTYGTDGAVYRTMFEEFSRIESHGTAGNGPESFVVKRKSGEILHYGLTADSRIEAEGTSNVRIWALSRIEDRAGNYIDFTYAENTATGEFKISRVDYTKNDGEALAHYNYIEFFYETRADTSIAYQAGSVIKLENRLTNIKVYAEGQLYRDYQITYGQGATERSRVVSVQECANGGSCFAPTTFTYTADGPEKFSTVTLNGTEGIVGSAYQNFRVMATGDFNADGLTDLYLAYTDTYARALGQSVSKPDLVWLSDGDGTFTELSMPLADSIDNYHGVISAGDFNGDGLTDFYVARLNTINQVDKTITSNDIYISDGDGTFTKTVVDIFLDGGPSTSGSTSQAYLAAASGDYNGDGLTDIYFLKTQGSNDSDRSNGADNDFTLLAEVDANGAFTGFDKVILGPDNGISGITSSSYKQCTGGGKGGTRTCWWVTTYTHPYVDYKVAASGDFNGDGLTDLFLYYSGQEGQIASTTHDMHVWISNGDGTFSDYVLPPEPSFYSYYIGTIADFNGDGLIDIYMMQKDGYGRAIAGSTDYLWLAKGDMTFDEVAIAGDGVPAYHVIHSTGDFNGDGLPDLYTAYSYNTTSNLRFTGDVSDNIFLSNGDATFRHIQLDATSGVTGTALQWHKVQATGDFNGDGLTDLYTYYTDLYGRIKTEDVDYVWLSDFGRPDVLESVTNGLGLTAEVEFKPLTDPSIYTIGTGPVLDAETSAPLEATLNQIGAGYVVAELRADNGVGGQNVQTYKYEALRAHRLGVGNLGFEKVTVTDVPTGIVTESTYHQDYVHHYQGLLYYSRTIAPNTTVLEAKTVDWEVAFFGTQQAGTLRCFRYVDNTVTVKKDLNGVLISTVTEEPAYDVGGVFADFGFPVQVMVTTVAGADTFTKITDNTYSHDNSANWILGRLTNATVTHKATGKPDQVRTSSFTYDASGFLETETIEPSDPLTHTKTYVRNGFGAVTSVTETWGSTATDGIVDTSRTTSYTYDAKARHRLTETNPLGHTQTNTYDTLHGLVATTTGPNLLTTSFTYDVWGRTTLETRADSTTTTTTRELCGGGVACPTGAVIKITTAASGAPTQTVFQDKLYREIRKSSVSLDGTAVHVDTVYDAQGRTEKVSEPFFEGAGTILWTSSTYDVLGRPLVTTRPDTSTQSVAYNGLETVATNELNQTKTVRKDALGRVIEVLDTQSNSTTYVYDAIGQRISMTDPSSNTITTTYDIRGNKLSMSDPDKGTWTYRYNALGLLVEQTDAKGQRTDITYDVLERMLTRTDDATGSSPETAIWVYDTATTGVGKLTSVTATGYSAVNAYDTLGRPSSTTETMGTSVYTLSTSYDANSRVEDTVYPTGLTVRNVYNAYGHLEIVKNATTSVEYWKALDADARGNITNYLLGNGVESTRVYDTLTGHLDTIYSTKGLTVLQDLDYTFDALGNLTQREDQAQSLVEDFTYDTLNRVIQVDTHLDQSTTNTVTTTYDTLGNITYKSDVGTYTYGQAHVACPSGHAGPHAVTTIAGTKNATYCYDENGNMVSGDGRSVTYSAFDKPTYIVKGASAVAITYGPDRARFRRVDTSASGTTTTHYVGGKVFEEIWRPDGTVEKKAYIGDFAVVTETVYTSQPTTIQTDYLLRDHLGSLDVITDELGIVVTKLSFDAWGKRREVNWTVMANPTLFQPVITTRGFTGHEQLDAVGLVHMNGRVYDAELGRFLSADPFVQDTENLQAWNRYSYVLNNPLSFTDPDGFFFKKIFKAIGKAFGKIFSFLKKNFKAILRIAITGIACANPAAPLTCAAVAVGTSFAFTLADGGSIGDALKAAAFAAVSVGTFTGVGAILRDVAGIAGTAYFAVKSAVHGVVGGALSMAQGGSFLQGFVSNAIGAATGLVSDAISQGSLLLDTIIVASAGGVAAELTGGKFANGALFAAFGNIFNKWEGWHMHHSVPKAVIKWLRAHAPWVLEDGRIVGRRGSPNRVAVEAQRHMDNHHGSTGKLGKYNDRFIAELAKLESSGSRISSIDVLTIRNNLMVEFFNIDHFKNSTDMGRFTSSPKPFVARGVLWLDFLGIILQSIKHQSICRANDGCGCTKLCS